ncbi:DUF4232 domain-containing protein [Kitasatospora sp. NBC_00240]|uniref:DUF4232 domain-containing protein n=1 Tax=Kitasatospora sp. NBC_00240 TaxID=2903567 RepID=UPI0022597A8F|nr:DUF4232 domain-containing protein [Kitasatospora sp. NBC_00240]MCX5214814.1 DUF4232 domain-containing protein [Kitasatospora sp. NBC_00240]
MHVRRVPFAVAAVLTAGLALTACDSGNQGPAAAPPAAGAPAGGAAAPSASATSAGAAAGKPAGDASTAPRTSGSAAPAGTRCTVADLELSVLGPDLLADDKQPAYASLHVVNVSTRTCTLTGFPGIQVADDAGRTATPLTADRDTGFPATAVTLKPKQIANANLQFSNVNPEGSPSGRRVCGVTAGKVQVILPDETQAKQVKVTGGVDSNTLNICGKLSVQPFQGVPGANG